MRTEQKIVVWDYRKKNDVIIMEDDDQDPVWPAPDWNRIIEAGTPRNVAYWQFMIRKGLLKGLETGKAAAKSSLRPYNEYVKMLDLAYKVRDEAESCKTLDSIMKIVDRGRQAVLPEVFGGGGAPDRLTVTELYIYGCIGGTCSGLWGSEEEMYSEKFAISETVIMEHARSRFLIINNSELEFTGNTGKSGKYPEIRFINRLGQEKVGLVISPKIGKTAEEYEQGKTSVFELTPAKEENWNNYTSFGKRYLSDASWDRLKPVRLNVSEEEAKQIYEKKTGELFEKERNKIFPLENNPEISKATDILFRMGFISCTSSYSGDLLVKQLADTGKALAELAQIMGLPLNAMSGYGKLSLGFAANVTTSYTKGLYSAKTIVIRPENSGALAHEWYHAMEALYGPHDRTGADVFAWINAMSSDTKTDYYKRCLETDKKQNKNDVYFSLPYEMSARAFEVFISSKTDDPVLVRPERRDLPYYPTPGEMGDYVRLFEQMKVMIRKEDPNNKKAYSGIRSHSVKYEAKKYDYFAMGEILLRQDRINKYRGMEYFADGQWKYLTPELREQVRNAKLKHIASEMELNVFLNK